MFKTKKPRPETPSITPDTFASSAEVARLAGVSLRQLQWWDEQKVVSPHHEGHRRVYSPAEVVEIAVIAELRRKGFSLQKIRRVLRVLQKEMNRRVQGLFEEGSVLHLLTDGKQVYLEDSSDRVVELLKTAKHPMFLVCVTDQVNRLRAGQRKPVRAETSAAASRRRVANS